jgi:hypothetical protein
MFLFIIFQFIPQLAQQNANLIYTSLALNSSFTIAGAVIIALTIIFFSASLIIGYMGYNYAFWIGLTSMILLNMLFYAGNFLLFYNFTV